MENKNFVTMTEALDSMWVNNFKCKAITPSGYCSQWKRKCPGWRNCIMLDYGAPCPTCESSSPLEHFGCKGCGYYVWKRENYES